MPFLDEVAARLVAQNVGVMGTNIFISTKAVIPAGNGPYLTIIETGGSGPTRIQNKSTPNTQRPTAQIAVRASTYPIARTMIKAAYDALDGLFGVTLSGTYYHRIVARQEPTDLGLDEAGRAMLVFNIEAEKQPS